MLKISFQNIHVSYNLLFSRKAIIHGDVKPSNILLDAHGNARLSDAGIAVEIPEDRSHYTASGNVTGTYAFQDPILKKDKKRRPTNDVFSYGVCMYFRGNALCITG